MGTNDIYQDLSTYFTQIQNKSIVTIDINDSQLKQADPNKLLKYLKLYASNENYSIRSIAFGYMVEIAKFHKTLKIKQEVIDSLVDDLVDNSEINISSRRKYVEFLSEFTHDSFSKNAVSQILQALTKENPSKELVRVCGIAQIKESLPRLEELLIDEMNYNNGPNKWYNTLGWNARLARARIGVKVDIDKCIELVKKEKDSDLKYVTLLPHIAYIHQPEAIEYLKGYFLSDLRLDSTNKGKLGKPVRDFLMPMLVESISNFPVTNNKNGTYSKEEIDMCRKWMSEQKEWKIIR